jgi:putative DNA primase/helicase
MTSSRISPELVKRAIAVVTGDSTAGTPLTETHKNGSEPRATRKRRREDKPAENPFPEETPWPSEVQGHELLETLCDLIRSYLILPVYAPEVTALWIAHTYLLDYADFTPYLWVTSPARECGKSTLLELLSHLAFRAQLTGGITAAALYRRIDRLRPTMLLDELDARLKSESGENLRAVLNTGFHRSGKMTICIGDAHDDKDFSTFCPKVLAGIGQLWDTVTSRSIPLRLHRAAKVDLAQIKKIRGDRIHDECLPYRQKLLRWRETLREPLHVADPVMPEQLGARQSDVWRPLLAIADMAGGRWPVAMREAACALHGISEDEGDYGLLLLADIRDLFARLGQSRLASAVIVEELAKIDDRPWPEYRHGKAITTTGIAYLLKRFSIKSKNIRINTDILKGYELDQFTSAFSSYLSIPGNTATSATIEVVADVAAKSGMEEHNGTIDDYVEDLL